MKWGCFWCTIIIQSAAVGLETGVGGRHRFRGAAGGWSSSVSLPCVYPEPLYVWMELLWALWLEAPAEQNEALLCDAVQL